jgi:hypothetical protein
VAQFSYFQAEEPADMAEDELWYNPDDLIIRRFIDGVWVPRGTYIPVDQQRCIVIKQAVINGLTVAGPVYILREGNAFSSAPIYDGGLDPSAIMRLVDAAYISIKDRTINSELFVPLTTHDGTETHIVLKPAFDWRAGGTLPQELVERIRAAGDDGVTLILTQVDLSDPTVPHDMIMITSYVANNGYFVYTITVFDQDNGPVATFGINSADSSVISEVSVTLTSFDVTAVVPAFTAINYVYAYSDDEYSETLDDAHTAAAELLLHAVAVHETETINADMLDRYLPTIVNKDDVKRHLVKNPGSDPSWDEYRHINGVWKYMGSTSSHNAFQIYRDSLTLISGDKENPDVGDIVLMYNDIDELYYGVASVIRVWGQSIDIVLIGRNLIPFDYGITYTSDNHLAIDTDRVTTKVVDGKLKAIGQPTYNPESGDPISGIGVAEAVRGMIKDVYYSNADGSKTSLLDGNAGANLAPIAGLRKAQGSGNNTTITDATDDHLTAKSYVDEIKVKIPAEATADNQLADKEFVNETVRDMAAEFRGAFATYAHLLAYSGEMSKLDYAIVLSDETRDGATTRYSYSGTAWLFQYIVNNTPFTQNQIDAINSGANADNIGTIDVHTEQIHTINSYLAGQDRRLDDDERDIDALQEEVVELQDNVSGKVAILSDDTTYMPDQSGGFTTTVRQGSVRNTDGSVALQSTVAVTPQGGSPTTHFAALSLYGADVTLESDRAALNANSVMTKADVDAILAPLGWS